VDFAASKSLATPSDACTSASVGRWNERSCSCCCFCCCCRPSRRVADQLLGKTKHSRAALRHRVRRRRALSLARLSIRATPPTFIGDDDGGHNDTTTTTTGFVRPLVTVVDG
jgi:hypothetical protein